MNNYKHIFSTLRGENSSARIVSSSLKDKKKLINISRDLRLDTEIEKERQNPLINRFLTIIEFKDTEADAAR